MQPPLHAEEEGEKQPEWGEAVATRTRASGASVSTRTRASRGKQK